jgi:hypothetical protein
MRFGGNRIFLSKLGVGPLPPGDQPLSRGPNLIPNHPNHDREPASLRRYRGRGLLVQRLTDSMDRGVDDA